MKHLYFLLQGAIIIVTVQGCESDSNWHPEDRSISYDSLFASANPETEVITEIRNKGGIKEYRYATYFPSGQISCVFPMSWDTIILNNSKKAVVLDYEGMGYCLSQDGDTLFKQTFSNPKENESRIRERTRIRNGFISYPRIEFSEIWERYFVFEKEILFEVGDPNLSLASKSILYNVISQEDSMILYKIQFDKYGCVDSLYLPSIIPFLLKNIGSSVLRTDTVLFSLPTPESIDLSLFNIDEGGINFHNMIELGSNYNYYFLEINDPDQKGQLKIGISFTDSCSSTIVHQDTFIINMKQNLDRIY